MCGEQNYVKKPTKDNLRVQGEWPCFLSIKTAYIAVCLDSGYN